MERLINKRIHDFLGSNSLFSTRKNKYFTTNLNLFVRKVDAHMECVVLYLILAKHSARFLTRKF
uniref:Uncharacterized protein n=1 Tax=Lepeophtheirus salmonis TaxID=72036 RepID=A0A0K2SW76_LEPSM